MIEYFDIILAGFSAYIVACVIGASSLFEPLRKVVITRLPKLRIGTNKHFIECRLCLGFWASLFSICLFDLAIGNVLPVYGIAYFLTTQER